TTEKRADAARRIDRDRRAGAAGETGGFPPALRSRAGGRAGKTTAGMGRAWSAGGAPPAGGGVAKERGGNTCAAAGGGPTGGAEQVGGEGQDFPRRDQRLKERGFLAGGFVGPFHVEVKGPVPIAEVGPFLNEQFGHFGSVVEERQVGEDRRLEPGERVE